MRKHDVAFDAMQDVTVSVGDASGFVFSGERHGTVSVLPLQTAHVSWTMVAYNAGQLTLPDIQLTSVRYSTCMRVTSSSQVGSTGLPTPGPAFPIIEFLPPIPEYSLPFDSMAVAQSLLLSL